MSSIKDIAVRLVRTRNSDDRDEYSADLALADAIESALKAERERAAKIVKSFDLSMWVKDGGKLREIFAEAILDENRTEGD